MKEYEQLLELAKADLVLAKKVINDKEIRTELILFHIQQVVEKAIKAILSYNDVIFPKTHDIEDLIELSCAKEIQLPDYVEKLPELTPYAVEFRYGFLDEEPEDAHELLELAEKFINFTVNILKGKKANRSRESRKEIERCVV
ncbi:MAG: HEPN domain-containing protein [bacterium]